MSLSSEEPKKGEVNSEEVELEIKVEFKTLFLIFLFSFMVSCLIDLEIFFGKISWFNLDFIKNLFPNFEYSDLVNPLIIIGLIIAFILLLFILYYIYKKKELLWRRKVA